MDGYINNTGSSSNANANANHNSQEVQRLPPNYPVPAAVEHLDPKRLRRLLMNREYAQKSRLKKQEYVEQLFQARNIEEAKIAILSPQVSLYKSQVEMLERENVALRQKLQEMEAQASNDDAKISQLKFEKETLQLIHMMTLQDE